MTGVKLPAAVVPSSSCWLRQILPATRVPLTTAITSTSVKDVGKRSTDLTALKLFGISESKVDTLNPFCVENSSHTCHFIPFDELPQCEPRKILKGTVSSATKISGSGFRWAS